MKEKTLPSGNFLKLVLERTVIQLQKVALQCGSKHDRCQSKATDFFSHKAKKKFLAKQKSSFWY